MKPLSIIVPALNEAAGIGACLSLLQPLRGRGAEVIVVDGGSMDKTVELARAHADKVFSAPRGRAWQMNAGAQAATGEVLLFLHADCFLPENADRLLLNALERSGKSWGRFGLRLAGPHPLLRVVEHTMNLRSKVTQVATGDQGIFVTRALFEKAGGFPSIALMEDIAFCMNLRNHCAPLCIKQKITASARRWESQGVLRTIFLMWRLRLAYFLGADPEQLALAYYERKS